MKEPAHRSKNLSGFHELKFGKCSNVSLFAFQQVFRALQQFILDMYSMKIVQFAANFCSGETQFIPQHIEKGFPRPDDYLVILIINI
jgi:hypothetical protein